MAPVYLALKARPELRPVLVSSGQHRDLTAPILSDFGLRPDLFLETMRESQPLASLSARLMTAVDGLLAEEKPAAVMVQGDTATVLAAAQAAFFRRIPLGHVEAGLRSGNPRNPFPEEMIRRSVSLMADWHFAPTPSAARNLLSEGLSSDQVLVTGNPVIDALDFILHRQPDFQEWPAELRPALASGRRLILVTCHRRENLGPNLENICRALIRLSAGRPETLTIFPVHPNPGVRETVASLLPGRPGIILTEPLAYKIFVHLMARCALILTDSGGLQEEAPALGKPVLVLRELTERPEGLGDGINQLVGTDPDAIVSAVSRLLAGQEASKAAGLVPNPFGDGRAAGRIADFMQNRLLHGQTQKSGWQ